MENSRTMETMTAVKILRNERFSHHSTMGVGGPARWMGFPDSVEGIQEMLRLATEENLPVFVMGSGSNLIVSDDGFDGVVINLSKSFKTIEHKNGKIISGSGVLLSKLIRFCLEHSLAGAEKLIGIPGTLGGAVKMNAGAFGQEISDCLVGVTVLKRCGEIIFLPKEKIEFSYRQSSILDIIVSAEFRFHESDSDEIRKSIAEISAKRKEQQPINFRSSGCIFKNPNEKSAGWLIDQAGLKGMQIGDAQISEKHANFFINTGASTAQDLYLLMRKVREIVYEKYKISLMPEVQLIGFEEAFDE